MRKFIDYSENKKLPMPPLNSRPHTPSGDNDLNRAIKTDMRHISNFMNEKMATAKNTEELIKFVKESKNKIDALVDSIKAIQEKNVT